jgi:hypothetical protein
MRTVGRTAVIAGTATAVSGRVSRRQQAKYDEKDQAAYEQQMAAQQQAAAQQPAPAPAGGGEDPMAQLKQLAELKDQGILTEQEFSDQKAKILAQM